MYRIRLCGDSGFVEERDRQEVETTAADSSLKNSWISLYLFNACTIHIYRVSLFDPNSNEKINFRIVN